MRLVYEQSHVACPCGYGLPPLSLSLDCRAMFSNSFVRPVVFIESSRENDQNGVLSGFLYFKSIVIID